MIRTALSSCWVAIVLACSGNGPSEETAAGSGGMASAGASSGGSSGGQLAGASGGAQAGSSAGGNGGSVSAGSGGAATAGSGGSAVIDHPPPSSSTASWVFVEGYQLLVGQRQSDGSLATPAPYEIKGISWSPTGVGESNNGGYATYYTKYGAQDAPLIENLNANTVKTYDPFEQNQNGLALLDDLQARGIMVIMQVLAWHGTAQDKAYLNAVNYFKGHPAILMWLVGNEFNYNSLYGAGSYEAALNIVNTAVDDIKAADPDHPVAVGFGEMPSLAQYAEVPNNDIWAINLYPGLNFADRFDNWLELSGKPMFVGEYGADAYDSNDNAEDQPAQATALVQLTEQIAAESSADDPSRGVLGGTPYSLTDEWWKASGGSASTQDSGGFANAIHPDNFANEEWWGLCTIQRTPRTAYTSLAELYAN